MHVTPGYQSVQLITVSQVASCRLPDLTRLPRLVARGYLVAMPRTLVVRSHLCTTKRGPVEAAAETDSLSQSFPAVSCHVTLLPEGKAQSFPEGKAQPCDGKRGWKAAKRATGRTPGRAARRGSPPAERATAPDVDASWSPAIDRRSSGPRPIRPGPVQGRYLYGLIQRQRVPLRIPIHGVTTP